MPPAASNYTTIATSLDDLELANPYQPGAVAPHRTFDGDGFRIRQLAFDTGAVLAAHSAPVPIIIHVACGSVMFEIEGEQIPLTSGAVLQVAADIPHEITAKEPSRLVVTLLG